MATRPLTVVVAGGDDRETDRLAGLLESAEGVTVVGRARGAGELRALVPDRRPAVALVAWRLAGGGRALVTDLRRDAPQTAVVVVADPGGAQDLAAAIDSGCAGLVASGGAAAEVVPVVRAAAAGVALAPLDALRGALGPAAGGGQGGGGTPELSSREVQVLGLLCDGRSTREIAGELYLSVNTVRNHVQSLLGKLGVHSRLEAVAVARAGALGGSAPDRG